MQRLRGFTLLEERVGEGRPARKGDRVAYKTRTVPTQGDGVSLNGIQAKPLPPKLVQVMKGAHSSITRW